MGSPFHTPYLDQPICRPAPQVKMVGGSKVAKYYNTGSVAVCNAGAESVTARDFDLGD